MNLLVTGAWQCADEQLNELRRMGHEVLFLQQEKDELPCSPERVEGVICNGLFLSHPIEEFPNLRYIQLTSAGYDRVPMDYVKAHDIEIHNARGVYSVPMAEFALCGVLQLYKRSRCFCENQKRHSWEKRRDLLELSGRIVLIVGCGDVGTECAKRFSAFGCHVIGVNRSAKHSADTIPLRNRFINEYDTGNPVENVNKNCVNNSFEKISPLTELDKILPLADVVVLTIALTEQTRHLISSSRFAVMKDTAVLVNISRGAVVDTAALTTWLGENPSAGAVLDVFEEEPLHPDSPLWDMDNVIITPHNSFVGNANGERLWKTILQNINEGGCQR